MKKNSIIIIIILIIISILVYVNNTDNKNVQNEEYKKIDLSNFTIEELIKIPGIGIKKAEDIKEYEEKYGFSSIEDLKNISGIGEKTFLKIKKYFYLSKSVYTLTESKKININTALRNELEDLPGIGPKTVEKIINYRKVKKIKNLEELRKVGLSNSQINQIKGVVEF
ncbi:competence protein ComEA [Marinitoga hydrogenitolerans DSM 16785]|uniref:Competence protein ComEA n=1 Tax=Marinitoga hydrogenitolerans (strain DSM 16785 / JCM 12826 / AT1271) TaxID=1122195 RepID=A0A1M4Z713_MARH1|nr:helix-hairpin-helix domain-containing protein [Marinitoga hydrogenitolerans]SHF13542.1 competence protein ComEA [Marinitoga hydrogenitolerans DSM 16785]